MALAKCRMFSRAFPFFLCGAAIALVGVAAPAANAAPSQGQIASAEAQVASLETTIANEQQQSAALDAQYLSAQAAVAQYQSAIAATKVQLVKTRAHVKVDKILLSKDALSAYVDDSQAATIDSLFVNSPNSSVARSQYQDAAVGNISVAVDALKSQQRVLALRHRSGAERGAAGHLRPGTGAGPPGGQPASRCGRPGDP